MVNCKTYTSSSLYNLRRIENVRDFGDMSLKSIIDLTGSWTLAFTVYLPKVSAAPQESLILFQRHAALLVNNNALCLMSGVVSGI